MSMLVPNLTLYKYPANFIHPAVENGLWAELYEHVFKLQLGNTQLSHITQETM